MSPATSEPGNIHEAFDDDAENLGVLDSPPPAAPTAHELFVAKARRAHELELSEAVFETVWQNPDLAMMTTVTTVDGMSYVRIPSQTRMPIPVAAKALRRLADLLEGKPAARICGACASDVPDGTDMCPTCRPAVSVDPLAEEQPPAPQEPCS